MKKDRGTTLTLEQYNLIVAFLRFGQKPSKKALRNAGIFGTLNEGVKTSGKSSPIARFKSIAKRLQYRDSDNELVFTSNSKIVLPSSRFDEVIMQAHASGGNKHWNLAKTMLKLSEKYTMGCRQFGICEDRVRVVIRNCKEGSCSQRNAKTALNAAHDNCQQKGHAEDKSKTSAATSLTTEDLSSTDIYKQNSSMNNLVACTLVQLQNGNIINIPYMNNQNSQTPARPLMPVMINWQSQPSAVNLQGYTINDKIYPKTVTASNIQGVANVGSISDQNLTGNLTLFAKTSSRVPVQAQMVSLAHNTILPGQMYLLNPTAGSTLSLSSNEIAKSDTDTEAKAMSNLQTNMISEQPLSLLLPNSSQQNLFGEYTTGIDKVEVIDLTSSATQSQESEHEDFEPIIILSSQEDPEDVRISQSLAPIPHPKIWYCYQELKEESNAYDRIRQCIKDMELDVRKSLAGSFNATEKLRKKIVYIQELITTLKKLTQHFKDGCD